MGVRDELRNEAEFVAGEVKEKAGKLTHNEKLEHEGHREHDRAEARQRHERDDDAAGHSPSHTDERVLPSHHEHPADSAADE